MRTFGLIGHPLSHSFSARYFAQKFEREGVSDARYVNFPLPEIEQLPALIQSEVVSGLNVTIPHKEAVIPFLDELDPIAEAIGAVNTIALRDGRLIGHNTDAFGFRNSLKPFLTNHHERALILGTGGASKAVAWVLRDLGLDVHFASRTATQANSMPYEEINEHVLAACKLIVNTTPLGTAPNVEEAPDLPYEHLSSHHLLYDLVYNPSLTRFLQLGQAEGASITNGLDMLKLQAEEAWRIWNLD